MRLPADRADTSEVPKTIKAIRGDAQGWFQAMGHRSPLGRAPTQESSKAARRATNSGADPHFFIFRGHVKLQIVDAIATRRASAGAWPRVKVMQPRTCTRFQGALFSSRGLSPFGESRPSCSPTFKARRAQRFSPRRHFSASLQRQQFEFWSAPSYWPHPSQR
jgi:hypothetical protein